MGFAQCWFWAKAIGYPNLYPQINLEAIDIKDYKVNQLTTLPFNSHPPSFSSSKGYKK